MKPAPKPRTPHPEMPPFRPLPRSVQGWSEDEGRIPSGEPRELLCQICGEDYPTWFADNELWNPVMRQPDGSDRWPFVCPRCFIAQAVAFGECGVFRVSIERTSEEAV